MTSVVKTLPVGRASPAADKIIGRRPTREEAEEAVRTLIRWAGDDPAREGLAETPQRVVKAYGELYRGYGEDPQYLRVQTGDGVNEPLNRRVEIKIVPISQEQVNAARR